MNGGGRRIGASVCHNEHVSSFELWKRHPTVTRESSTLPPAMSTAAIAAHRKNTARMPISSTRTPERIRPKICARNTTA
jgi:hypothetical protein